MIRNRLHLRFVHGSGSFFSEVCPRRNDPKIGRLASASTGTGLNPAGIDSLLGLAAGQIRLLVHRPFSRKVLALLVWSGIADDDQLGFRIILQPRCYIVEDRFAGVVDSPRLVGIRVVARTQLAGGWRRWWRRRRCLDRHLSRRSGSQAT